MTLHLHHPERISGPCDPTLVREEALRTLRAARFAADLAWDQREDAACARLNEAFHAASAALVAISNREAAQR